MMGRDMPFKLYDASAESPVPHGVTSTSTAGKDAQRASSQGPNRRRENGIQPNAASSISDKEREKGTTAPSERDLLDYIAALSGELSRLAQRAGQVRLGTALRIAEQEAKLQLQHITSRAGSRTTLDP